MLLLLYTLVWEKPGKYAHLTILVARCLHELHGGVHQFPDGQRDVPTAAPWARPEHLHKQWLLFAAGEDIKLNKHQTLNNTDEWNFHKLQ